VGGQAGNPSREAIGKGGGVLGGGCYRGEGLGERWVGLSRGKEGGGPGGGGWGRVGGGGVRVS